MSGNRKQAPKSRHDRGEREKPMASRQPKPDPDKEIVILQYAESKPSNLSKFKRWIGPLCVEKYGILGTLIETGIRQSSRHWRHRMRKSSTLKSIYSASKEHATSVR